ncbi:hypothetical protein BGY98DRAFT_596462 [Russula aff. rugulosa BPL654]|nr:hypothetical protein BGY98DRAFT_596462 [Russula aff. rugulosa BPL654]
MSSPCYLLAPPHCWVAYKMLWFIPELIKTHCPSRFSNNNGSSELSRCNTPEKLEKAGGNRSGKSDTLTESPKHLPAPTAEVLIVLRTYWPKERTCRSEAPPAIPEQAASASPPKEETGGNHYMLQSSESYKFDMQENSGIKCNISTLSLSFLHSFLSRFSKKQERKKKKNEP